MYARTSVRDIDTSEVELCCVLGHPNEVFMGFTYESVTRLYTLQSFFRTGFMGRGKGLVNGALEAQGVG